MNDCLSLTYKLTIFSSSIIPCDITIDNYKSITIRCAKCLWHLAYQTPKTNLHQVFQIKKILAWDYSTLSNMRQCGHQCQKKKFCLFIYFFSLLTTHIFLSVWFSHRPLYSSFTTTPISPRHWPPCHATKLAVPSTTSSEPPIIGSLSISLQWWVLLLGLFDLGWVLRFGNEVGCGLVMAVVLWLWRQFGGCGGYFLGCCGFFFF